AAREDTGEKEDRHPEEELVDLGARTKSPFDPGLTAHGGSRLLSGKPGHGVHEEVAMRAAEEVLVREEARRADHQDTRLDALEAGRRALRLDLRRGHGHGVVGRTRKRHVLP